MAAVSPRIRLAVVLAAALAALAGAAGLTQHALFSQASDLKYALTVAGPVIVAAAAAAPHPLLVLLPAVVIATPFAGFVATLGGVRLSPLALLLAAAAAAAALQGRRRLPSSALGLAAAPILLLLAVPVFQGDGPAKSGVVILTIVMTAWLAARAAELPRGMEVVLGSLIAGAALQGVIAIWEFRSGHQLNLYGAAGSSVYGAGYFFGFAGENRPTGSLYDPISLGNVLAISLPPALALSASARSAGLRLAAAAGGILAGLGLALTLSRMSWIGGAAGLAVALLLLPRGARGRAALRVASATAAIAAVALAVGGSALTSRFSSILDPTNSTVATASGDRQRVEYWRAALTVAEQHPLAGVGFGDLEPRLDARVANPAPGIHAHSTYLQLLAEGGVLGGLALLLAIAAAARDAAVGVRRSPALGAGIAGALVAMLVLFTTDFAIRYVGVAGMFAVALGAAAARGGARAER